MPRWMHPALAVLLSLPVWGAAEVPAAERARSAAASGLAAGLAVVDESLEAAVVLDAMTGDRLLRQTQGIVGEASTENALGRYLNRGGKTVWRPMTPRTGPQGIDHLFVRYDASGRPVDIYVAESKWGSSRLGETKDGRQMGSTWAGRRLEAVGRRYEVLAGDGTISCRSVPKGVTPNAEMSVMVKNGRGQLVRRVFWRESSRGEWHYAGPAEELPRAQKAAGELGRTYGAYARGTGGYRRSVYHWKVSGDDLVLRIDSIDRNDVLRRGTAENERLIVFKGAANGKLPRNAVDELVRKLKLRPEYRDWPTAELRRQVEASADSYRKAVAQQRFRALRAGGLAVAKASLVSVGLDAALQLIFEHTVDWRRLVETGGKTAVAVGAAELAGLGMMRAGVARHVLRNTAKAGVVMAVFASFDYYRAWKGDMSWEDAHANLAIAGTSMGAGAAAGAALMALPAMLGATAGTGTAIASLSGAAATNATLAFYGGGTLAAGGFGAAGGAILVSGGVLIVAVGVGAAAAWGYGLYKEGKEWAQTMEWGAWLRDNVQCLSQL